MDTLVVQLQAPVEGVGLELFGGKPLTALSAAFGKIYDAHLFKDLKLRTEEIFHDLKGGWRADGKVSTKLRHWMDNKSYMVLGELTVFAPVGLKGTYLEYLTVLEHVGQEMIKSRPIAIDGTRALINTLINNPDYLTGNSMQPGKQIDNVVSDCVAKLAAQFDHTQRADSVKYSDVVKRNADMDEVVKRTTLLTTFLTQHPVSLLERDVKIIFNQAEELFDLMRRDEDYQGVSKVTADTIAKTLQATAEWIEFYGVFLHAVKVFDVAIDDSVKKLSQMADA